MTWLWLSKLSCVDSISHVDPKSRGACPTITEIIIRYHQFDWCCLFSTTEVYFSLAYQRAFELIMTITHFVYRVGSCMPTEFKGNKRSAINIKSHLREGKCKRKLNAPTDKLTNHKEQNAQKQHHNSQTTRDSHAWWPRGLIEPLVANLRVWCLPTRHRPNRTNS